MKKPKHIDEFETQLQNMNLKFIERDSYHRNNSDAKGWKHEWNQKIYDSLVRETQEYELDSFLIGFRGENEILKSEWNTQRMCSYMKVIPFIPSVMINISPDWGSVDRRSDSNKVILLKGIIERYLAEGNRYFKASYVIENGAEGTHIHAHIVAQFQPLLVKSVNTHLMKGNHSLQLMKQANKLKGMKGMLKGVGIQKVFLRTETLVSDKLDYLIEENKPEGHKNKSVIMEKVDLVF